MSKRLFEWCLIVILITCGLFAGLASVIFPVKADNGIAFDAVSVGLTTGTQLTFSHTCTGDNLVLFVGVMDRPGESSAVTGVTYDGEALVKIDEVCISEGLSRWISLWYLISPSTGANNIVVTASESTWMKGHGASYSGCKQSDQPDGSVTNTDLELETFNTSLVSVADSCWHIMFVANSGGEHSAGAETTLRGVATSSNIMDSNSGKSPSGNVTLQATRSPATGWGSVLCALKPVVLPAPDCPAVLSLTDLGGRVASANWTSVGSGMDYMVRVKRNDCPSSVTDGELAYSGNLTSCNITGLALESSKYGVAVWTWNGVDFSACRTVNSIGGEDMLDAVLMVLPLASALVLVFISFFQKSILIKIAIICCMWAVFIQPEFQNTWLQAAAIIIIIWAVLTAFFRAKEKGGI